MVIREVCNYLDKRFPLELAEDFDLPSIGFAIGQQSYVVKNILFALDLTREVVNEAIERNCNLIITHHPFLFSPINKIIYNTPEGEIIKMMIKHDLSLYSMHTNLDVSSNGVNDTLAQFLNIKNVKIENDTVCKKNYLRYGEIEKTTLKDFALKIKETFNLTGVRVLGELDKEVKTIGVVGGSGAHNSDLYKAKSVNLDCYITGEVKLSSNILAQHLGLSIIEVSHSVESFVFYNLKEELEKELTGFDGEFIISSCNSDKMIVL